MSTGIPSVTSDAAAGAAAPGGSDAGRTPWQAWRLVLLLVPAVPALNLWLVSRSRPELFDPLIVDTDTLMRLVRVRAILETGWGDGATALGGVPYSQVLQWTAPLDALLAGLTGLLQVAGVDRALEWSAVLASPILQGLTCAAILCLAPRALPRPAVLAGILLAVLHPVVMAYMAAGRGDHHALLLLLFAVAALAVARFVAEGGRIWPPVAGLAVGLGLWVSVEALAWWGVAVGAMGLLWVAGDDRMPGAMARTAGMAAVTAALAWCLEAALGFVAVDVLDRLSVAWLTGLALSAAALAGLAAAARPGWPAGRRAAALAAAGTAAGAVSALLAPGLLAGPFGEVDRQAFDLWAGHVNEMKPLSDAKTAVLFLALPAAATVAALAMARGASGPARARWLVGAAVVGGFAVLTVLQLRWASYAGLTAGLLAAPLVLAVWRSRESGRGVRVAALLCAAVTLPWLLAKALDDTAGADAAAVMPACNGAAVVAAVNDLQTVRDRPLRVLTAPDHGPAVAFHTPADAAIVPAHRMGDRIVALALAMRSGDPAGAAATFAGHGVTAIALCRDGAEAVSFDGGPDSVYRRLIAGETLPGFVPAAGAAAGPTLYVSRP